MGILNVTADSFYASSRVELSEVVARAAEMINEGADILDIGAQSTRPNAPEIETAEELRKVASALEAIRATFPEILLSVDTFRSEVAEAALASGADIINDISGGNRDKKIWAVAQRFAAPYILMHSRGNSQTMMQLNSYEDLVPEIISELSEKIMQLRMLGISDIIVDPGFGFAKSGGQNFKLLRNLERFQLFDLPILVGLSRKSMIYKTLNINADDALTGTIALNVLALNNGANILRVHDVKAAKQTIELWMRYQAEV